MKDCDYFRQVIKFRHFPDANMWIRSMKDLLDAHCIQLSQGKFAAVSAVLAFRSSSYSLSKFDKTCCVRFKPAEPDVLICIMRSPDSLQTNFGYAERGRALAFVLDGSSSFIGRLEQGTRVAMLHMPHDRFAKMVQSWFGFASPLQVKRLLKRGVSVPSSLFDNCVLAKTILDEEDGAQQTINAEHAGEDASIEASLILAFLAALVPLAEYGNAFTSDSHHLSLLEKAVDFILINYAEKIMLTELCEICGASASTLIGVFTRYLGITPMKFILMVRLQEAHTLLCSVTAHSSVTNVATEVGFWHFGRFSGYYRSHFLELPSETLWGSPTLPNEVSDNSWAVQECLPTV
jgi:AraC-like DNA-binding protein